MFDSDVYPQLLGADFSKSDDDEFLKLVDLVTLDFDAVPRVEVYKAEDHGIAIDFDLIRDEVIKRQLGAKMAGRWGLRDEMMVAFAVYEAGAEREGGD